MIKKNHVKIAQIGCGYWGSNLLRNILVNFKAELVAVCDISSDTLQKIATKYPNILRFNSLGEMLQNSSIEAVIVATPSGLHYNHVLASLDAGKHVFVEKPLASSVTQAIELIRASECKKRILMVGHTFLYNNLVHEVKKFIDSGALGDIYYAYSQRLNLGILRQDSDVLWTLAPHDVSIMNYLFGSRPSRVAAQGITCINKKENIAEVCFAYLEYPNGPSVHLHISWLEPQKKRQIILVGSNKMLIYDDLNTEKHIQIFDKRIEQNYISAPENFFEFVTKLRAGDIVIPNICLIEPLQVEIEHFINCIQNGISPLTGGRNGLEVVAILESLTTSMQNGGCLVSVEYPQLNAEFSLKS